MLPTLQPGDTCLILGAGISGLLAARQLTAAGIRVTLVDKGRGVGGRMATRRVDNVVFDHGAQFITVRSPEFAAWMDSWKSLALVGEWSKGFLQSSREPQMDGHPRYFIAGGMTAVPKHLGAGLDVHINSRVVELQLDRVWRARLTSGEILQADGLILTPPVPQALDLLDLGGVEIPAEARASLSGIRYHPCLTWMAVPTSERRVPKPGGVQFREGDLQFLADNQQKGISPEAAAITIHTSTEFSRRYFDADEMENWTRIVGEVAEYTGPVRRAAFHRWRYSQPVHVFPQRCLHVEMDAPLVFCGDAFGEPRVEGAALSGLAAARSIIGIPLKESGETE